jgi:hypothetical protein
MINHEYLKARAAAITSLKSEFWPLVGHLDWTALTRFGPEPGWESLIRETLTAMLAIDSNIEIQKIRNKIGECDIFPNIKKIDKSCYSEIMKLYDAARVKSRNICCWCGVTETVRTEKTNRRLVITLCDACWDKFWQADAPEKPQA